MDDSEIRRRVDELDAAVTKEDAKLLICYGEEGPSCELVANRKGYLRAGIELLNAGMFPLASERLFVPIDLGYLTRSGGLTVGRVTRREDVEAELTPASRTSAGAKFAAGGSFAVFIFLAVCAIVGFSHVIEWLARK